MQKNQTAVRWGVIGLGGVVVGQIAPAIVTSAHSKLVGSAGSSAEKTRAFAQQFGVTNCHAGIAELAADDDVEAIFIATPNADHHRRCGARIHPVAALGGVLAGRARHAANLFHRPR